MLNDFFNNYKKSIDILFKNYCDILDIHNKILNLRRLDTKFFQSKILIFELIDNLDNTFNIL